MRKLSDKEVQDLKNKGARVTVTKKAKPKLTSPIKKPAPPTVVVPDTVPELKALVTELKNQNQVLRDLVVTLQQTRQFPQLGDLVDVTKRDAKGKIKQIRCGEMVAGIRH